jgi:uncharacterized protein with ParB-like and HNH nuclease domain
MNKVLSFQDILQLDYGNNSYTVFFSSLERQLLEYKKECNLDLNPEFQRGYVWTETQKEKYVEFLLRGGKSARDIYFNFPHYTKGTNDREVDPILNRMVIVDGKQRLSAILGFMRNEVKAFGYFYKDFDGVIRHSKNYLTFNINELTTRKDILNWYLDFNSGGTVHTEEELDKVRRLIKTQATL